MRWRAELAVDLCPKYLYTSLRPGKITMLHSSVRSSVNLAVTNPKGVKINELCDGGC
jgi:hypothetical protein